VELSEFTALLFVMILGGFQASGYGVNEIWYDWRSALCSTNGTFYTTSMNINIAMNDEFFLSSILLFAFANCNLYFFIYRTFFSMFLNQQWTSPYIAQANIQHQFELNLSFHYDKERSVQPAKNRPLHEFLPFLHAHEYPLDVMWPCQLEVCDSRYNA
jgi:hypothetical protein